MILLYDQSVYSAYGDYAFNDKIGVCAENESLKDVAFTYSVSAISVTYTVMANLDVGVKYVQVDSSGPPALSETGISVTYNF